MTTRLRAGWSCVRIPVGKKSFFPHLQIIQTDSGTNPASDSVVIVFLSVGVNWPERDVDHSYSSSMEFKNGWSCTSTPRICLMA